LLTEYQKAPEVTRERLYIEAMEDVYSKSNKVLLDAEGSGSLLYLPIDQLMKNSGSKSGSTEDSNAQRNSNQAERVARPGRDDTRSRGNR
jgi:membrane protease subunit HflK